MNSKIVFVLLLLLSCFCIFSTANANAIEMMKNQGSLRGLESLKAATTTTCTYAGDYCNSCNKCSTASGILMCYCMKTTTTSSGITFSYNLSLIKVSTCSTGKINNVDGKLTCVTS